nr:YesL family protein [uncultured Blautia sp.]
MNLLNEDNIIHIFLNKLGDIIIANLLFLVCCIPIITIGPALTALYHCMLRTVKGNNNGTTKTFFRAFKENFLQSLIVWLGLLAVGFILFLNIQFLQNTASVVSKPLFYVSLGIAGLVIILALYIFPVIAAFANTTVNLLKNAYVFAFLHFPSTLAIAVITILPMFMTYRDIKLMPLYACCWFFFGFGLTAYVNSLLLYRMFKPFLEKEDA